MVATNVCTGMGAVVFRYSHHSTIKLALIVFISYYTAHDAHAQPGSFSRTYDPHATHDMLPQHQVNITKLITECF